MKTKWLVMAGLALAPATVVLTGCGGGSNGALNLGGGGNQANQFAGVQGNGPLLRNGAPVGNVQFAVNNNGVVNATLNTTVADDSVVRNAPRAVISASANVAADGSFTLVFTGVNINGVTQNITIQGKLSRSGNTATLGNLQITSTAGGTLTSNFSITVAGSPGTGTANGTFNVSGGNSAGGSLTSNAGAAIVTRANGKIVNVVVSFNNAGTSGVRSLNISANDAGEVKPGIFSIGAGEGFVTYQEVAIGATQPKVWRATTGTVTVDSLTSTQIKVSVSNLQLTPQPFPNNANTANGTVTVTGSGTGTIQ
ncbi:MAG TPA: hypothetical protein VF681_07315 [Abditibacteriaceae bacterium]